MARAAVVHAPSRGRFGPFVRGRVRAGSGTTRGELNGLEQRYVDEVLAPRLATGEIIRYDYEALRLRLAHVEGAVDAWYTPDFVVQLGSGEIEMHEVKGYCDPKDMVRLKVAASRHPYVFVLARREKHVWVYERIWGAS